jgi:hypothetical protein
MSKSLWILGFAVAALSASSLSAEPPPFPTPKPPTGDPAAAPPAPRSEEPKGEEKAEPDAPPRPESRVDAPAAHTPADAMGEAQAFGYQASDSAWVRWTGSALRFEQARFQGEARLFARSRDQGPWEVFRGADLATILRANPTLANHPELDALKQRVAGPAAVRLVVQGYNVGYEEDLGAGEGRLYARTPQGERMWTGRDLATIAAENPDVAQLPEWREIEARARAASASAAALKLRPDAAGIVVVTFAPREVTVALNQWRDRGWQSRSFRGPDLVRIVRGNRDLGAVLDLGDVQSEFGYPATPTAPPGSTQPPTANPPRTPTPPRASAPVPAPAPTPSTPPHTPPAGGGGSACGAGGKNCGGR